MERWDVCVEDGFQDVVQVFEEVFVILIGVNDIVDAGR